MKILGSDFKISYADNPDTDDMGECCFRQQEIHIQRRQHHEAMQETLVHEIVEAINHKLELDLPHEKITAISCAMFSVLRDNGIDIGSLLEGEVIF